MGGERRTGRGQRSRTDGAGQKGWAGLGSGARQRDAGRGVRVAQRAPGMWLWPATALCQCLREGASRLLTVPSTWPRLPHGRVPHTELWRGAPCCSTSVAAASCAAAFPDAALLPEGSLHACVLSRVPLFRIPWTVACQAPLPMGLSLQESRSGFDFSTSR